jgi:hypothetical protein
LLKQAVSLNTEFSFITERSRTSAVGKEEDDGDGVADSLMLVRFSVSVSICAKPLQGE